jgi:hypothetical protein
MGAFIQLKEPPRNKRILLDIGIAGPIAGLVVAIPILLLGLSLSRVDTIQINPGQSLTLEGNSLIYLLAKYAVFGQLYPQAVMGISHLSYWVVFFSQPMPVGGTDVMITRWPGQAGPFGHCLQPDPGRAAGQRACDVCLWASETCGR